MEDEFKPYESIEQCANCFFRKFCETCDLPDCSGEDYVSE